MGGYDPYSCSKACSELITSSYENSFFPKHKLEEHLVSISTVRAGNVIGGGDFASNRLIPDFIKSILEKKDIEIRNPNAIRPWQHVLEPLSGYLLLAEKMYNSQGEFNGSWNFGPEESDAVSVEEVVKKMKNIIETIKLTEKSITLNSPNLKIDKSNHPHEAMQLKLDISKVKTYLNWKPKWNIDKALTMCLTWTDSFIKGADIESVCNEQIYDYLSA